MEKTLERVEAAAWGLLGRLEQAAEELDTVVEKRREKVKTDNGECVTEYERKMRRKGAVDRAGLKQLTGVLKDLQDILMASPELTEKERLLRLERLEKELTQAGQADAVTVTMEGGTESYAD